VFGTGNLVQVLCGYECVCMWVCGGMWVCVGVSVCGYECVWVYVCSLQMCLVRVIVYILRSSVHITRSPVYIIRSPALGTGSCAWYSPLQIGWHSISRLFLKLFQGTRILPMGFTINQVINAESHENPGEPGTRLNVLEIISRCCATLSAMGCTSQQVHCT